MGRLLSLAWHDTAVLALATVLAETKLLGSVVLHRWVGLRGTDPVT